MRNRETHTTAARRTTAHRPCEDPGAPSDTRPPRRAFLHALWMALGVAALLAGLSHPVHAQSMRYERLPWSLLAAVDPEVVTRGFAGDAAATHDAVPARLRDLHGRHVVVEGFVMPLDIGSDGTTLAALAQGADACRGPGLPRPTEWILVQLPPGQRALISDLPTTVRGRLFVADVTGDGPPASLYRLEAESVVPRGVLGW